MYVKLDQIVREAIADKGYNTLHKYVPYLHFAIRGLEEWHRDGVFTDLRTTKLKVSVRRSIPFPKDMVMWNRLGVVRGNRIQTFVRDHSLSLSSDDHKKSPESDQRGLVEWDDQYDFTFYTNIYVANEGAISILNDSATRYFTVNYEAREFNIASGQAVSGNEVYLEYISNGFSPSTETMVNYAAKNLIREWINYSEAKFKFGSNNGETRARLMDYLDEKDEVRAALSDLTMNGILSAMDISMTRTTINQ